MKLMERPEQHAERGTARMVVAGVLVAALAAVAAAVAMSTLSADCWGGECQPAQYDQPVERR